MLNRSKLFEIAWQCVRKFKVNISTGLKMAWACIKREASVRNYYGIDNTYNFEFKLWSGYGKRRAYYTTNGMSKYWNSKRNNFVEF